MASAEYRVMHKQSAWFWTHAIDKTSDQHLDEAGSSYFAWRAIAGSAVATMNSNVE